ncbi:NUDIX hydrolase [Jeotgalibacillus aurantiacus]|uniref:NUDIX hydrolase n=1 Tax=Jeotgalibacillus aurantiacus TaxID=2763266 RepID=UPI001D0A34A8|nr:NUDIX hydrolase [Jeotgalibacillus aurantiacus]
MHPKSRGCFTIVQNEKEEVLLVKRKDYPLWDLPGGVLDDAETLSRCAEREIREESGYIVSIQKQIAQYEIDGRDVQYIFSGVLEGGTPIQDGPETAEVRWFPLNRLPYFMIPHRKKQIKSYLKVP